MSTTRLPELPAPNGFRPDSAYTADQLHAYGLAVWKEAKEAAAQMCEAQEGDATVKAIGKGCAAAIRSLPDPSVIQQGPK